MIGISLYGVGITASPKDKSGMLAAVVKNCTFGKLNPDNVPIFDTKIDIDNTFINTFIKGKNALADVNSFTVFENGSVKIIIGYSTTNSNRVTIPVKASECFLLDYLSFDANIFKEILLANRECTSAKL